MNSDYSRVPTDKVDFHQGFWLETTSGRVALVTCTKCGATVTNDPGSYLHTEWHRRWDKHDHPGLPTLFK